MAFVVRCDGCRVEWCQPAQFDPTPPWLCLVYACLDSDGDPAKAFVHFCDWKCAAEWTMAKALIESAGDNG